MISVPLYIFLFVYLGGFLLIALLAAINIRHLFHTGTFTMASFLATFFFLAFVILVLWGTWSLLQNVNWQEPVYIFKNSWFGGSADSSLGMTKLNY